DGNNEELFAHYSTIKMEGYKTLKAGQPVTFDILKGEKGSHAINISALTVEPASAPENNSPKTETIQ
ncbi:MAG TPA: cold shock domain-containing protein, partial [Cellvibrio sp.]|nr:cold shock domain-containing protein [Cellvibrio sp.]